MTIFQALKGQPVEENENSVQAPPREIQSMESKWLGVNYQLQIKKLISMHWFSKCTEHKVLPQQAQLILTSKEIDQRAVQ